MGVEYKSYVGPEGDGFVVCLIPESVHKPHRAEFADKHYYYRAGDDFLMAEPGLLRTLFYPKSSCRANIQMTMSYRFLDDDQPFRPPDCSAQCSARILVEGPSTGRDVYVRMVHRDKFNIRIRKGIDWDFKGYSRGKAGFVAERPLHPGEESDLFYDSDITDTFKIVTVDGYYVVHLGRPYFEFEVFIADQERQKLRVDFDLEYSARGQESALSEN